MSVFPSESFDLLSATVAGLSPNLSTQTAYASSLLPQEFSLDNPSSAGPAEPTPAPPAASYDTEQVSGVREFWFEIIHVFPKVIDLGNILSTVNTQIEIFNGFTRQDRQITSFTNGAGSGSSITNLPGLPNTLSPLEGLSLNFQVTTDGPPTIDGDLEFGTDAGYDLIIPVTASRIVVFPFVPTTPLDERLFFLTDVLRHKDSTEQRISARKNPRQEFTYNLSLDAGRDLNQLDILMFEWQSRVFGVPVWTQPSRLESAITANDTTIYVDSTTSKDFRVGKLAIVWSDERTFDALEIAAVTSTSITFASPILKNYDVGARVMPVVAAITHRNNYGNRYSINLAERQVLFRVLENETSFAPDATPYLISGGVLDGEIFVDEPLMREGMTMRENFFQRFVQFDNETGKFSQVSAEPHNARAYAYQIKVNDHASMLRVRRLLYALRGRQVSFFVRSRFPDLTLAAPWANASATITVANVGYSRYARGRERYKYVRIVLNSGTILYREVSGFAEIDGNSEQITFTEVAPYVINPEDVSVIQFMERTRLDKDEIYITHVDDTGQAVIDFAVRTVIQ